CGMVDNQMGGIGVLIRSDIRGVGESDIGGEDVVDEEGEGNGLEKIIKGEFEMLIWGMRVGNEIGKLRMGFGVGWGWREKGFGVLRGGYLWKGRRGGGGFCSGV
ncbi:hypothetical protein, partial [Neisseria sicca]|uniref:hypothetical protein n=1 Tax=Neisseria sicca TaxID=490 RepID=UPI001649DB20